VATDTITQAEREATADFDAKQNGAAATGDDERSREEAEPAGQVGEEDDGQFFVLEEGRPVGLSTLVKRGTRVEYEFKLDGHGVPGATGMSLIGYADPDRIMVVPGRAGKVVVDPTYDGDGRVKKVTIRQHFKPTMVYDARTEAGRVALSGE
jgi:hypothetical protein